MTAAGPHCSSPAPRGKQGSALCRKQPLGKPEAGAREQEKSRSIRACRAPRRLRRHTAAFFPLAAGGGSAYAPPQAGPRVRAALSPSISPSTPFAGKGMKSAFPRANVLKPPGVAPAGRPRDRLRGRLRLAGRANTTRLLRREVSVEAKKGRQPCRRAAVAAAARVRGSGRRSGPARRPSRRPRSSSCRPSSLPPGLSTPRFPAGLLRPGSVAGWRRRCRRRG